MEWRSDPQNPQRRAPTRRQFMAGLGAGGALILGFELWPRRYLPNLVARREEYVLGGFLKIARDGPVTVVVPQVELGQASTTLLPQIVADELGADWRSVGVEPAPLNPLYANTVFADDAGWASWFDFGEPLPLQVTDEGIALRAFAVPMRQAAATARMMLCMAAAKRWGIDAAGCETAGGFVMHEKQRLRFADLVAEAARLNPAEPAVLRQGASNRLIGTSVPRLDAPAKVGGTALFAADIRLPDMVFATLHQGPLGETRVAGYNEQSARAVRGAIDVVALPSALACVGETSWVAAKMLVAARPYYTTRGKLAESAHVLPAAVAALQSGGTRALALGDADTALAAGHAEQAHYQIGLLPHLALEPLAATARFGKGLLEIWSSSQLPEMARDAAAHATGLSASRVVIHSVMGGGSSGRRFESEVAVQAALLAVRLKRPVQLFWSRGEDTMHDRFGGGYAATLSAQVQPNGSINAWHSAIAGPPAMDQLRRRTLGDASADAAMRAAGGKNWPGLVSAAAPPYAIVNVAIDLHAAATTIPSGPMRGGAALATCFWNESFVNELAAKTGVEPFSFRMALVGDNTRLAQCLAKVTALAGWTGGGRGGNQGLACFATEAMAIAVVAEAKIGENGRVQVSKLTAVADLGQLINPDIARQHIEGGLLFGMQLAVGAPVIVQHGLAGPSRFGDFKLPLLADMPEVTVELLPSNAPAADAWDCAVPVAAPAIAGALFAGSGKRFRTIPFTADQS